MNPSGLLARMEFTLPSMLADIEQLLRCESPSEDLAAVARSAKVVAAVGLARLGVEPECIVLDGRTHLRWRLGSGTRRVLLLGHHDTVWPLGSLDRHPVAVVDGVLRGPGCFDMLSGVVMALHAVAAQDIGAAVTILITGDEELGSPSSRGLIEDAAQDCVAALVLEASADGGALKTERKGVSRYEVRATGRAAHAGLNPELGVNAAVELAHQILRVQQLADPARGTSVTPTALRAGTTSNTIPADGLFAVDVRAREAVEQRRVDAELHALAPFLEGAQIEVRGGFNRPPLQASASTMLYRLAARTARELGLPVPDCAAVGGASDGNFTAGIGTPTLDGLGAVGGGAHADDEHVVVAELPGRTALLAALIHTLLGGALEDHDQSVPTNTQRPSGATGS